MQVKDTSRSRRDYGILAGICLFLQVAIAPYVQIGLGHANLAVVFAAIVAMLSGGPVGVLVGFLSGLIFDLSTTGPIGLMAFILTIASFVVGMEGRNRLAGDLIGSFATFAEMAAAVGLTYQMAMFLTGDAHSLYDVLVLRTLPSFALTFVAFLPFALVISHATSSALNLGKVGSASHARGSRYDLDI